MKEMTTAEFAKANLANMGEVVKVRRYTKVIGTYYPDGFDPGVAPPPLTLDLEAHSLIGDLAAAEKRIRDLEDEVKRLKRDLAARPPVVVDAVAVMTMPKSPTDPLRPRNTAENPFASLPKQDREFFERKLGTRKK